jgi:hydrogenase/urease accessory protein HupE
MRAVFVWLALVSGILAVPLDAHESRPAYLEITEVSAGRYTLNWRTPVLAGMPLPVALRLPDKISTVGEPITQRLTDSLLERRIIETGAAGLAGQRIEFVGLQATITDVLVRIEQLDGSQATTLVHPSRAWLDVPAAQGKLAILATYVLHGFDHILLGFDHLLFVLALILIVRSTRVLVWTITAFTAAHSITLALATLRVIHVPSAPVEATIALSIVLLAYEIFRIRRGEESAIARWPWVVAFSFGLLHGFGFAGALTDLGLPRGEVPLALFAFNVGVELGQLAFITAVLAVFAIARFAAARHGWAFERLRKYSLLTSAYGIGGLAAFWFFERVGQIIRF